MRNGLSIVIASIAAGCASPARGLELTQQSAPVGTNLHVKIVDVASSRSIVDEYVPIDQPTLDVTYGLANAGYRVFIYEDLDGDGRCTPADHAWQLDVPASSSLVHVDLDAIGQDPVVCGRL